MGFEFGRQPQQQQEAPASPHPSDASTVVGPAPPLPQPPAHADSDVTLAPQQPTSSSSSTADGDDKGRAVASVEEEVVVDRGGSQGSGKQHGRKSSITSSSVGNKEEGKANEESVSPEKAPDLAAQPKSRSLPAVLRSSYRGDWRLLLRRLARRGGDVGADSDDEDEEGAGGVPKAPPSIISSLHSGVHTLQSNVQSMIHEIEDRFHRMPKWQYRLLVGSLIFLVCALGFLTVITVVYGFGMTYPHISLTKLELALPFPHLDRDGSIPVVASVEFNNPNSFGVRTKPAVVKIYTMPSRTPDTLLGQTAVPGMELRAHREGYTTEADFRIKDVGHVKGGQAVVDAVLKGTHSFLYTETDMDIVVKSLGFLPIRRTFQASCKILKVWGGEETDVLLSDCYGQFGRSKKKSSSGTSSGSHRRRRRLRGSAA